MKIRKAIKKIVALGMGASMLGATILGASAADLNAYPAPFVQNGKFAGTMVVGDNAAAEDVIGVSDIAMSLQYSASVRAGSGSATTTTVEGDAYEFTKSANKLNLYENLTAIRTTLTDEDLSALADGTFKGKSTESYTQTLRSPLASGVGWYDYNDVSEEPALYFKLDKDASAFNYTLNFGTDNYFREGIFYYKGRNRNWYKYGVDSYERRSSGYLRSRTDKDLYNQWHRL